MNIGIGIRIGQRRGVSWPAYWASLISATVENAAPTHLVLTFPNAQPSLDASDFTVAGFTISSASWTGAVLTLVLSEAVIVFDEDLTITFNTTGQTATVTNNVADDGETVGWYEFEDLTGALVSSWTDKTGLGHHLVQTGADALKPSLTADGVLFDGSNDFLSAVFAWNQPCQVYMDFKVVAFVSPKYIFDGSTADKTALYEADLSPVLRVYAGTSSNENTNLVVGTFSIVRILFNGASSSFQIDETAAITGDYGANNAGGFWLGGSNQAGVYSNIKVRRIILRKSADAAPVNTAIYECLKKKNNEPLTDSTADVITDRFTDILKVYTR